MINDQSFDHGTRNICSTHNRSQYLFFNKTSYTAPRYNLSMYFFHNQSWTVVGQFGHNWTYGFPLMNKNLSIIPIDSEQFREDKYRCPSKCNWFHANCADFIETRDGYEYAVYTKCCKRCQGPCHLVVRRCNSSSFNIERNISDLVDLFKNDLCTGVDDYYYYQVKCWCKLDNFTCNSYYDRAKKREVVFSSLDIGIFVISGIFFLVNAYLIAKLVMLWNTPLIQHSASLPTLLIVSWT